MKTETKYIELIKVTDKLLQGIEEKKAVSTRVVGWYPYAEEVRGPYYRWLTVSDVAPEYEKHVAPKSADAEYAALAMNTAPALVAEIRRLRNVVEVAKSIDWLHRVNGCHVISERQGDRLIAALAALEVPQNEGN